jgi:acyl-CoA thioester hydrolase, YbgC/YbaW family
MHEIELRIRLSETDALGIVYYSNYFVFFDIARIELLREIGIDSNYLNKSGINFVCSEACCKYLLPLEFDDLILIKTWIERLGKTSISYRHIIVKKKDNREAAHGFIRDVLVDNKKQPIQIPEYMREKLERYLLR